MGTLICQNVGIPNYENLGILNYRLHPKLYFFENRAYMVQNALKSLSIHQPISVWDGSVSLFPEHCRSHSGILDHLAVLYSKIPEHAHSVGLLFR